MLHHNLNIVTVKMSTKIKIIILKYFKNQLIINKI